MCPFRCIILFSTCIIICSNFLIFRKKGHTRLIIPDLRPTICRECKELLTRGDTVSQNHAFYDQITKKEALPPFLISSISACSVPCLQLSCFPFSVLQRSLAHLIIYCHHAAQQRVIDIHLHLSHRTDGQYLGGGPADSGGFVRADFFRFDIYLLHRNSGAAAGFQDSRAGHAQQHGFIRRGINAVSPEE